jgi:hypothetical protein
MEENSVDITDIRENLINNTTEIDFLDKNKFSSVGIEHSRQFARRCFMKSNIYKSVVPEGDNEQSFIYKTFSFNTIAQPGCIDDISHEIYYQTLGNSLSNICDNNKSKIYDFIVPKIYSYGNVVPYNNDDETKTYYIKMEFMEGEPYTDENKNKIDEVLSKLLKEEKLCHNDDKPENIFINKNGEIIILDWGEAHILPAKKKNE